MVRRLTTILAADVVGYSRLMGADEAGTLAALKGHRVELFDPKAAQYGGRTVKLMGDGALMEFASVVDAVSFSVEVQAAMAARNAGVAEDRRIGSRKVQAAFQELHDRGFIVPRAKGSFDWKQRQATEWEITTEPCDDQPAKRLYRKWLEKQNTSFGLRASKSSVTRGSPPVIS